MRAPPPAPSIVSTAPNRRAVLGSFAAASVAAAVHRPARAGENGDGDTLWVVTTQTAPWRAALDARYVEGGGAPDVLIDEAKPGQTIEGFGACFNELGWDALSYAPAAARHEILREFFGPDGARFSLCRMPVGANDFSRDWYSYDEARGDFGLERFSVANDDATLVPFIKAALAFRPDLGLWASPWSPPTWMKTNGHYAAAMNRPTWPANGLRPDQVGREGSDMFILEPKYLEAYGRYFGKFIDAYRDRGVRIGMVMPQNEFNSAQVFPSCCWTPEGLAAFIPYLGEQMSRRGVEVFLGTLERPDDGLYEKSPRIRRRGRTSGASASNGPARARRPTSIATIPSYASTSPSRSAATAATTGATPGTPGR